MSRLVCKSRTAVVEGHERANVAASLERVEARQEPFTRLVELAIDRLLAQNECRIPIAFDKCVARRRACEADTPRAREFVMILATAA
jgi:hypothetical protein